MTNQQIPPQPAAVVNPAKGIAPSVIRTIVPAIVAWLIVAAAKLGVDIDDGLAEQLVTAVVFAVYYAVVRWLEVVKSSRWGWLLGKPSAPLYPEAIITTGRGL